MSDNLKKGKYMDKNKNNDRRWDVFKTISNVIIKVLAIFVAGTIVTFAVPVTIINIFQGNNPTNSSSIIEDLKTSKIENSILEVYDSSQGVADGNYGNAIVIDEVYTLYKRTMTQLECMETSFFPYGYQSPDVTMVGYGERIVVKNYFDVDDNIDYNNILTFSKFYKELNKDRYRNLRGMLYFYEYIGSVVKMHEISYNQIFSLIYFPDDLNNKLQYIISKTRKMKPEFLENYCCLRSKFEKTRRKNECYCQIKK